MQTTPIQGSTHSTPVKSIFRKLLFGNPLPSSVALEHRLPIGLALPVFASDAVSSVAYSTQEILMVLAGVTLVGGGSALDYQLWISLAIAILIVIVATSYRRAVILYPTSGGSYTVTKHNLGPVMGLVAAAALLIDYVMTVAVSISSGVDALLSAYPALHDAKVEIAVLLVAVLALANLRGTKESGWAFALPLYSFIGLVGIMILLTVLRVIVGGGHIQTLGVDQHLPAALQLPQHLVVPKVGMTLGVFVLLR
ncbi:MAG TPA: amino acid permease, partial [Armatimonadota bacterium]|nr:amino acid permease [Armatimonadota bacterium]